jgi:hypothetical protein
MTGTTCSFCGTFLTLKANLVRHQKTIRCKKLQKQCELTKQKEEDIKEEGYQCKYCQKSFTRKEYMNKHEKNTCPSKPVAEEIQRLRTRVEVLEAEQRKDQQIITDLRAQLARKEDNQQHITLTAVSRPTTSVRNTIKNSVIQNLLPLKEEEMKEHTSFLTLEHIKEGPEGYAKFALERPFKDRITCTDVSRKKLAWKNDAGEIIYDSEGQQLSEKFFRIMRERNETLCKEIIRELGERLGDAWKRDDHEEANAIAELTDKIQTWRREAFQASKGNNTDLSEEFSKALCKMSTRKE